MCHALYSISKWKNTYIHSTCPRISFQSMRVWRFNGSQISARGCHPFESPLLTPICACATGGQVDSIASASRHWQWLKLISNSISSNSKKIVIFDRVFFFLGAKDPRPTWHRCLLIQVPCKIVSPWKLILFACKMLWLTTTNNRFGGMLGWNGIKKQFWACIWTGRSEPGTPAASILHSGHK